MLRNGKVRGIRVNLSREPFLGMAHGVHGGPCRNAVRRHPGVEGLARRVKIEAASELILERDSGRSQVFFECPKTREHPHDQIGGFHPFRPLGAQFFDNLGMQPDGIPLAVFRLAGTQADKRMNGAASSRNTSRHSKVSISPRRRPV